MNARGCPLVSNLRTYSRYSRVRTDVVFNIEPKPDPRHVQLFHVVLRNRLIDAPENAAANDSDRNGESNKSKNPREGKLFSKTQFAPPSYPNGKPDYFACLISGALDLVPALGNLLMASPTASSEQETLESV